MKNQGEGHIHFLFNELVRDLSRLAEMGMQPGSQEYKATVDLMSEIDGLHHDFTNLTIDWTNNVA